LAHSRLWDAVGGFLFLFAHMQDKLSKHSSQLDLLIELLDLQKEMVVMMLSMLEGNVVNGTIGRQMVDTLVESASNVELILKFFDMFLKLKGLTSSAAFQEMDKQHLGWISPSDFRKAMEQQKVYSADEISYLMACCEPNHEGLIDYIEFTERFHNPAKEIGFNLAVLLTNLSEHMPSDTRLSRFLELAASVLNYFEPFLGRIEIMGSAKRVERVYFEIKESSIAQWEKPQIKESKRAFLYSVVNEGGDKEKLELFVNFCEDAIFEMQHAASISMEDEDEPKRAVRRSFSEEEDHSLSVMEPLTRLCKRGWTSLCRTLSTCTPSNLAKRVANLKEKTPIELVVGTFKLAFGSVFYIVWCLFAIFRYFGRILLRLMTGEPLAGEPRPTEQLQMLNSSAIKPILALPYAIRDTAGPDAVSKDGRVIEPGSIGDDSIGGAADKKTTADTRLIADTKADMRHTSRNSLNQTGDDKIDEPKATTSGVNVGSTVTSTANVGLSSAVGSGIGTSNAGFTYGEETSTGSGGVSDRPEHSAPLAGNLSFNIGRYTHRFICFLARNFYTFKNIALVIAFVINFILLFYKISSNANDTSDDESNESTSAQLESAEQLVDQILSAASGEQSAEDEELQEYVTIQDNLYSLSPLVRALAVIHSILALCLLIGYYHLKLPLAIFKREKEISRAMEFDGLYITEQNSEYLQGQWDKLVISTRSFPVNYWDKFVKKRVREAYAEQFDYESISRLLGMEQGAFNGSGSDSGDGGAESMSWWRRMLLLHNIDYKYTVWKAGVTITDQDFIYNLVYFVFSLLGNVNYFFFAAHLLDIAFVIKSLRTILQSVTHNGRQLMLTVILLVIVVYIYTVIAFNFFRKFYVQSGDDDDDGGADGGSAETEDVTGLDYLQDKKCHSMYTCFIFNLYQGKWRRVDEPSSSRVHLSANCTFRFVARAQACEPAVALAT
jgi:ryanodine receptor 2